LKVADIDFGPLNRREFWLGAETERHPRGKVAKTVQANKLKEPVDYFNSLGLVLDEPISAPLMVVKTIAKHAHD
jgi:hypothetical protein